jgi:lipopolysaccharide/colanic/teichoic acid biosynthesis glycosyltransferase
MTRQPSPAPYFGKSAFDRISAGVACVAFAPIAALIAAAITLEDGGPPLFLQPRVGRNRRPFVVVKFRSMANGKVTDLQKSRIGTGRHLGLYRIVLQSDAPPQSFRRRQSRRL